MGGTAGAPTKVSRWRILGGPVMKKFSQSKGAAAQGRKYTADREDGCPSHRYGHGRFGL